MLIRWFLPLLSLCILSGCSCGDTFATRQVRISESIPVTAASTQWRTIEVDTTRLPPGTHIERSEHKDACGNPITDLTIIPEKGKQQAIKIIVVPADGR